MKRQICRGSRRSAVILRAAQPHKSIGLPGAVADVLLLHSRWRYRFGMARSPVRLRFRLDERFLLQLHSVDGEGIGAGPQLALAPVLSPPPATRFL